ncbi:Uma2 family endonuclease [Pseudanabaena sp. FACHB-2040]|uniref:Uma2 family endonuclease n=1 Tax=Pseudanabaena sp. FACHB-2040 TaxID=2692859 RepID=UPI0016898220|nr:Uma2 family endonuclease [Pseudanabaena sp. FACHB-2040]MBD2260654.1 Uma2 family endonuclease [Pseudanabaena sp. FACHB-2040]
MIQPQTQPVTFDEFIDWYPEGAEYRYELHDGAIVEVPKPTGKHSEIAGFIAAELNFEIRRSQLPYFVPKECVLKQADGLSGYEPDVIVLDRQAIAEEPRWAKESIITQGKSVRLVVEVVSTNWRDDYGRKVTDYEAMGIAEYWIVDYLALGAVRYIGSPKEPTFSIYRLVDGEYQVNQLRGEGTITSRTFLELALTAAQVFAA